MKTRLFEYTNYVSECCNKVSSFKLSSYGSELLLEAKTLSDVLTCLYFETDWADGRFKNFIIDLDMPKFINNTAYIGIAYNNTKDIVISKDDLDKIKSMSVKDINLHKLISDSIYCVDKTSNYTFNDYVGVNNIL